MKKAAKKKDVQEKSGLQEIKIRYQEDKMILALGKDEYYLDKMMAISLFGDTARLEFDKLSKGQLEDFSDLNTPEFVAKFQVAHAFYGNLPDAAKYLKIEAQRLRRWMADNYSQRQYNKIALYEGKFEYQEHYKKYREELFGEERIEKKKPFNPDLHMIDKIANLVMEKIGPRDIARRLKVDYDSYLSWFTARENQRKIDLIINNELAKRESLKRQEQEG